MPSEEIKSAALSERLRERAELAGLHGRDMDEDVMLDAANEIERLLASRLADFRKITALEAEIIQDLVARNASQRVIAARDRRIERLVSALNYAREKGFQFPVDAEPPVILSGEP